MVRCLASALLAWVLALLPLAAARAVVVEKCITTQTQLDDALISASYLTWVPHVLRVKSGSYELHEPRDPVSYVYYQGIPMAPLQLLGGYNADCSARSVNPTNTVLKNSSLWSTLVIHGDWLIEGVTITFEGLRFAVRETDDVDIELRSNILRNAYGDAFGNLDEDIDFRTTRMLVLFYYTGSDNGHVRLVNNLVYGISNLGAGQAVFRLLSRESKGQNLPDDDIKLFMANNTVIQGDDAVTVAVQNDGWGPAEYYNNVFVPTDPGGGGFTNFGISNDYGDTVVSHNLYGKCYCSDIEHSHVNVGNQIIASPAAVQFIDAATNNYRLLSTSPALNSGDVGVQPLLPLRDLDGQPRFSGGVVDRGAYEYASSEAYGVVTNSNDSGSGSLRAAIDATNASTSLDRIVFNIPGDCPRTITLLTPLPAITDTLLIDGYSQPGAAPNTLDRANSAQLCVLLKATSANTVSYALGVNASAGSLAAQGLGFGGFDTAAVLLTAGSGHQLRGNQFGDSVTGPGGTVTLPGNTYGVLLGGSARGTVGGPDAASRNIVADSTQYGVFITSNANLVQANYIGLQHNAFYAAPNGGGIYVGGDNNILYDNTVAGNNGDGVRISGGGKGNVVIGNTIGEKPLGLCFPSPCTPDYSLPNGSNGVLVDGAASDNLVSDNLLAHNGADGVRVASGTGNRIRNNRIDDNFEQGIDIAASGATGNDDDAVPAADNLGNRGQNFPLLLSTAGDVDVGQLRASLSSRSGSYTIEAFRANHCILGGMAQGERRVGKVTVTIGQPPLPPYSGSVKFNLTVSDAEGLVGEFLTLTATDSSGNTSEFGNCLRYVDHIFVDDFDGP